MPPLPRGCTPPPPSARAQPPERAPRPASAPEPNPGPNPNQGNTIREFSFLENPRAAALKASTASTALVAGAGAAAELKRLVASYADTKVLPHRGTSCLCPVGVHPLLHIVTASVAYLCNFAEAKGQQQ